MRRRGALAAIWVLGVASLLLAARIGPERLPFRRTGGGFEQEVRLRRWEGDLRWTLRAPGCEPIELHCDHFTCEVR